MVVLKAPLHKLHLPSQSLQMANHIFTAQGKKQTIDQLLAGDNKDIWSTSTANELG
jgi:hypothetical protein